MTHYWFIDLDETLIESAFSWGMTFGFPNLVKRHHLPFDQQKFDQAIVSMLKISVDDSDPQRLVVQLFEELGWSLDYIPDLLKDMKQNFKPALFDDTIPFLEKLRQQSATICLVSNNIQAPDILTATAIKHYFDHIFTISLCKDSRKKPHPDMWACIMQSIGELDFQECKMVGDDPWSDGAFADHHQVPCVIIDRRGRYQLQQKEFSYRWVSSLSEIIVE